MYLTAMHVVDERAGAQAVHAFHYRHELDWEVPPPDIPDQNPGVLVSSSVVLQPGGNRVRSYLDVVAPDGADWTEIRHSFMTFVAEVQRRQLPWEGIVRRCRFRVGMELALARRWHSELADLYRAVQAVRIGG